jgi:hypothetical protein
MPDTPASAGPLDERWSATRRSLIAWLVVLSLLTLYATKGGFLGVIDWTNLAFHEFGHPFFGMVSERLGVYGGTIFQLVFPVVVMVTFYRQREIGSFALGIWWIGENLLNIGWYMRDAVARLLPTTSGENDWEIIFTRWDVLKHDLQIGGFVRLIGWTLMLAAIALVGARLFGFDRLRALRAKR